MILAMLATPIVSAGPWNYPKNNDKFESFATSFAMDPTPIILAPFEYTPSMENPNKVHYPDDIHAPEVSDRQFPIVPR